MTTGSPRRKAKSLAYRVAPYLVIAAVLLGWEFAVRFNGIQPIFLPAPSSILKYLIAMIADGSLPYHLSTTFLRIIAGFLVAGVTGIVVGVLMGMSPLAARIVDPWIAALYPLPKIS